MASFPFDDDALTPTAPREDIALEEEYCSFPNLPKLREMRTYAADGCRPDSEREDDQCNKYASKHASLLPGNDWNIQSFQKAYARV